MNRQVNNVSPDITTTQSLLSLTSYTLISTEKQKGTLWELLNTANPPFMIEAELEDDGGSTSISLVEVNEVVKELHCDQAPETDNPEWLSWMTHLFNIAWKSGAVPKEWQTRVVVSGGFSISKEFLRAAVRFWAVSETPYRRGLTGTLSPILFVIFKGRISRPAALICSKPSVKGLG